MKLNDYEGKNIRVKCKDGIVYVGYVVNYIHPEEDEDLHEAIYIKTADRPGVLFEVWPEEIDSIELCLFKLNS